MVCSVANVFHRRNLLSVAVGAAVALATTGAGADDGAVVLSKIRVKADAVETATGPVEGYVAKRTRAGTKTDVPLIEVPQSISVVTRQDMDDRNVQNAAEAVAYTAGVRTERAGIDSRVDDIAIRGFDASSWSNNMYLDGVRVPLGGQWSTPQVDAYGLERVEVIKGPAAVLYGQVAPGGLVNMVSKRPTIDQTNEVMVQVSSHEQIKGAFDLGGALDGAGRWLGRLVGSYNEGDSQIDVTELSRTFVAPSLTILPSDNTELTLLSFYQKDDGGSTFQFLPLGGTYYPTQYGRIDRDTFIGEPDWNTYDREQWAVGYEFSHRFNDVWSFDQNVKYTHMDTLFRTVVTSGQLRPDNRTIARRAVQGDGDLDSVGVDNRLRAEFDTGELHHDVMLGLDYLLNDWQHVRYGVTAPIAPIDVYAPVYSGAAGFAGSLRAQSDFDTRNKQLGVYVQDLIALDQWRFTLGVRRDSFDNEQSNSIARVASELDDDATTWRAGVTYLFDNGIAPYFSYATSFEPISGFDAYDRPFDPTEGMQVEVGVKFQPEGSNSLFTVSLFDLRQENLVVADTNPPASADCAVDNSCQRQAGETRTRGVELEGKFWLSEGLSLTGAYTYLDTEVLKSTGADEGKQLPDVPEHAASAWLDYRWSAGPLAGASAGVGVRYTGNGYGDELNDFKVDSYTLYDAALRYDFAALGAPGLQAALTASNLSDEDFFTTCTSFGCAYGSGRNVAANLKYRW